MTSLAFRTDCTDCTTCHWLSDKCLHLQELKSVGVHLPAQAHVGLHSQPRLCIHRVDALLQEELREQSSKHVHFLILLQVCAPAVAKRLKETLDVVVFWRDHIEIGKT